MTEKNIVIRVLKNAPQVARIRDNGVVRTWLPGQRGLDRELAASSERARGSEGDSSLAGQCTPTRRATKWLLFSMAPSRRECHTGAFQGRTGEIAGTQGRAYVIRVADGNMMKTVVARPEHLRPIE